MRVTREGNEGWVERLIGTPKPSLDALIRTCRPTIATICATAV
jgi:hypothetical protein